MTFTNGQEVWIWAGDEDETGKPVLSRGTILASFKVDAVPTEQFIIMLDDPEFMAMEVRDASLMTADPTRLPSYSHLRNPAQPPIHPPMRRPH